MEDLEKKEEIVNHNMRFWYIVTMLFISLITLLFFFNGMSIANKEIFIK